MKKPRLICAMPLRRRPESPGADLQPMFSYGVRRDEIGVAGVRFTIYLLFTDGQGEWPVEINLITMHGKRSGRPLTESVYLEDPLSIGSIAIDTGIRISRLGYNFITVDLDGETIARVPFRVFALDTEEDSL